MMSIVFECPMCEKCLRCSHMDMVRFLMALTFLAVNYICKILI